MRKEEEEKNIEKARQYSSTATKENKVMCMDYFFSHDV